MIAQQLLQIRSDVFKTQDPELGAFDVIFGIDEKKIYAHKFMLQTMSTTFSSMISDRWTSKDVPIPLDTYDYDDFYQFLTFLYSGECRLTDDNIFAMIDIAEFYQVQIFKNYCEEFLTKIEFTLENVFLILEIVPKYSLDKLKEAAFVKSNVLNILNCDQMLQISKEKLLEIITMCKSNFPAEEVFEKVFDWAENQAMLMKDSNQTLNLKEIIKEILADFMPFFNFAKMDYHFTLKYLVGKALLPPGEIRAILSDASKYRATNVNVKISDTNGNIMKGQFCDPANIYEDIQKVRNLRCIKFSYFDHFYWSKRRSRPSHTILKKRDEIEWYLVYDCSNDLAVKRGIRISDRDYLIAELFAEDGFVMSYGYKIEAFRP